MSASKNLSKMIPFHDYGEGDNGVVIVRTFEGKVALCLSLESNGDVEAVLDRDTVEKVIAALSAAIT
ncbi:MAG: hypothetical protein ACF8MJ_05255 [Phycisphaerales bacterium JB050]